MKVKNQLCNGTADRCGVVLNVTTRKKKPFLQTFGAGMPLNKSNLFSIMIDAFSPFFSLLIGLYVVLSQSKSFIIDLNHLFNIFAAFEIISRLNGT